jgi:hypothetical protein
VEGLLSPRQFSTRRTREGVLGILWEIWDDAAMELTGSSQQFSCAPAARFEKFTANLNRKKIMSAENNCPKTGEFSWNELVTQDVAASKKFYSGLFGWKT